MSKIKKILLAADRPFWRMENGSMARLAALISHLRTLGYELGFFYVGKLSEQERAFLSKRDYFVDFSDCNAEPNFPASAKSGAHIFADFREEKVLRKFKKFSSDFGAQALIIEYIRLAHLLEVVDKNEIVTFLDAHDIMSQRARVFAHRGLKHWLEIGEKEEAEILARFDFVLAIQAREASDFRKMLAKQRAKTKVLEVGHSFPLVKQGLKHGIGSGFRALRKTIRIAYLACLNEPNEDAMRYFCAEVLPIFSAKFRAEASNKRIALQLGGGICELFKDSSGEFRKYLRGSAICLELMPKVADLEAFYAKADVAINPVRFGGGLKIKTVEALCYALPLIASPPAFDGLDHGEQDTTFLSQIYEQDLPFFLVNSPHDFASALLAICLDSSLRARTSKNAIAFAKKYFSAQAAFSELEKALL